MTSKRFIYYILAAFIAGNLLVIFIQFNATKNITALIEGNEKVISEFKVETELRDLRKNIVSIETRINNAIHTTDTSHITNLQQEINAIEGNLNKLQQTTGNDLVDKYIDELDMLVRKKIAFNNHILENFNRRQENIGRVFIDNTKEKELTDSIAAITHTIDSTRRQLLTGIAASIDKSGQDARRWGNFLFIIVAASGALLFWFIVNRVKRQNQLIQQLDASEKKVKDASRAKENFMANMSHEIRTPMHAILGFTGLLQKKELDADAALYVHSIQQSGENLLAIVNDILDFSKFEAGKLTIETAPFSIHEVFQSIEVMFMEKAKEKNLALRVNVHDSIPAILEGDAGRLRQILVNLAGNALKFTAHGSIRIDAVGLGASNGMLQACFRVRDTGIGIEKENLPGIFERFKQADASITRRYGGTGLGLSIVKDLVTLQKGTITVTSEPGAGSEFSFIIPYKIPDQQHRVQGRQNTVSSSGNGFSDARILVVEDNKINQTLMKHLLGRWQLSFAIARSGADAIALLEKEIFSIVLMDIQMPEMDGYTATQTIRQKLRLTIPIIAMTAHALDGEKEKCMEYGMNAYISKPVHEVTLMNTLRQFLQPVAVSEKNNTAADAYKCINLQYMHDISNGNTDYEKTVTEQFIEMIPADLQQLQTALATNDFNGIRELAHTLKTTVSVMGLTERLGVYLDTMEYEEPGNKKYTDAITMVNQVCQLALEEARVFYTTL